MHGLDICLNHCLVDTDQKKTEPVCSMLLMKKSTFIS